MLGAWSAKGEARDVITLRQAFAEKLGTGLAYAKGTDILSYSQSGFGEAIAAARQADIAILALGESASDMTGEAASRTELDLPGNQQQLLEAIAATGKPIVLLVFSGRPLVLTRAAEQAGAILAAGSPGSRQVQRLCGTLYGNTNPSGRLTASFPRSVGQEPLYYNQLNTGRPLPLGFDLSATEPAAKYSRATSTKPIRHSILSDSGLSYTTFSFRVRLRSETTYAAGRAERRHEARKSLH